jgi:hypothetical protein
MSHKNQQTIDALAKVTEIMIELWYGETNLTVGEITRSVERCSEIFQFMDCDETIEVKLIAVLQLCEIIGVYFREPKQ